MRDALRMCQLIILLFVMHQIATSQSNYYLVSTPSNWTASEQYCISKGSHLASIHSPADLLEVQTLCGTQTCWLGLSDIDLTGFTGTWAWTDGTPTDYGFQAGDPTKPTTGTTPWASNQPDWAGTQRCLVLWPPYGMKWDNAQCSTVFPQFVCNGLLSCPEGSHQINELNRDIAGCGLQSCDDRYDLDTIEQCQVRCDENKNCVSFSWAPIGGDNDHLTHTVCTIYDTVESDRTLDGNQVLCHQEGTSCGDDVRVIESAISGIIQVTMALIALWLVVGYLTRFRIVCQDEMLMIFSVLGCLLLAFMHGCVQSFILTNVIVPDADTILQLRCNGLFWHQIFILQIGQLLIYTYLLSKLHSLNVFRTAFYYFLILFVSIIILFTNAVLPWYSVPQINTGNCVSDLVMCINATPSDSGIYDEYAIFLGVNLLIPFVLLFVFVYQLYQLCTESGCCRFGRNKFTYKIFFLGMIVISVQLAEFICFLITEETFHTIMFTVYTIIILASFRICAVNEETGNALWCCWCCIEDKEYRKVNIQTQQEQEYIDEAEDNIIEPRIRGPYEKVHGHLVVGVVTPQESIGLI